MAALVARQKTCHSFPRLSSAVTCNFDSAVFFESYFCNTKYLAMVTKKLSPFVRGTRGYKPRRGILNIHKKNILYSSAVFTLNLCLLIYFIRTFCADRKYQRSLRMDAFFTPNEADDFWALRNSFSYPRFACITHTHTVLTLFQKSLTPFA